MEEQKLIESILDQVGIYCFEQGIRPNVSDKILNDVTDCLVKLGKDELEFIKYEGIFANDIIHNIINSQ